LKLTDLISEATPCSRLTQARILTLLECSPCGK